MSYHDEIQCKFCYTVQDPAQVIANGGNCLGCDSMVCLICGCTTDRACAGGCYWIRENFCSSHKETLLSEIEKHFGVEAASGTRRALAAYEEAHPE